MGGRKRVGWSEGEGEERKGGREGMREVIVTSSKLLSTDHSSAVSVVVFIRREN